MRLQVLSAQRRCIRRRGHGSSCAGEKSARKVYRCQCSPTMLLPTYNQARSTEQSLVSITIALYMASRDAKVLSKFHHESVNVVYPMVHRIWAGHYAAQSEGRSSQRDWDPGLLPRNGFGHRGHPPDQTPDTAVASSSSSPRRLGVQLRGRAVQLLFHVCKVQKLHPSHLSTYPYSVAAHLPPLTRSHPQRASTAPSSTTCSTWWKQRTTRMTIPSITTSSFSS